MPIRGHPQKISDLYGDSSIDFRSWKPYRRPGPYGGSRSSSRRRIRRSSKTCWRQTEGTAGHPPGQCDHPRSYPPGASGHPHPARIKSVIVRYRIDGVLTRSTSCTTCTQSLCRATGRSRPRLDISERRRPQDGRITVKTPMRMVDLRISTCRPSMAKGGDAHPRPIHSTVHTLDRLGFFAQRPAAASPTWWLSRRASSWLPGRPAAARRQPSIRCSSTTRRRTRIASPSETRSVLPRHGR